MQLSKEHRQSLINELSVAKEQYESNKRCLNHKSAEGIKEAFEIKVFLSEQQIGAIERALIDNEIDY